MIPPQAATARLRCLIAELEAFDPTGIATRTDPRITGLEAEIESALIDAFGDQTTAFKKYEPASTLDTASYRLDGTPLPHVIAGLIQGKDRSIILLMQALRSLQQQIDSAA